MIKNGKEKTMTKQIEIFQYNDKFYHIERDIHEIRETYLERVWYILQEISNEPNGTLNNDIINKSKIYSAKRLYGCEY